jgi:hypothetical protein
MRTDGGRPDQLPAAVIIIEGECVGQEGLQLLQTK